MAEDTVPTDDAQNAEPTVDAQNASDTPPDPPEIKQEATLEERQEAVVQNARARTNERRQRMGKDPLPELPPKSMSPTNEPKATVTQHPYKQQKQFSFTGQQTSVTPDVKEYSPQEPPKIVTKEPNTVNPQQPTVQKETNFTFSGQQTSTRDNSTPAEPPKSAVVKSEADLTPPPTYPNKSTSMAASANNYAPMDLPSFKEKDNPQAIAQSAPPSPQVNTSAATQNNSSAPSAPANPQTRTDSSTEILTKILEQMTQQTQLLAALVQDGF